jgi:HK97 family phage portal protein
MGLISSIFNRGKTTPENPQYTTGHAFFPSMFVPNDLRLSPDEALSVSAVYACVRVIAEAMASSCWDVYVKENEKRIELEDDPIAYLLNVRPNPEQTAQAFREGLLIQALVHGNGYAEIVRDVSGRIKELWLLPSEQVTPRRDENRKLFYRIVQPNAEVVELASEDVFHLRALTSISQLMGDSVLGRASKAVATAHAAERFALNYFGSNATIGSVLKLPKAPKDAAEEQEIKSRWDKQRSGVKNAHGTIFIGPGMEFTQSQINAEQAQITPARQFSVDEIARYFGVPSALLNQTAQLPGQDLEGLGLMFTRYTLTPWKRRLEQEANYKLFPQRQPWKFTEIEVDWLNEGSAKNKADTFAVYLTNGVMSVNEVRDEIGLNDIGPDGDEYKTASSSPDPAAGPQTDGMDGTMDPTQDPSTVNQGLAALHQLILGKHKARIDGREQELKKTLKNGVLAEKIAHAKDWSRGLAEQEFIKAGVAPPAGWNSALDAVEAGGDPAALAKALNEVKN